ncbi:hypothetical protein ACS0TY_034812 [Phlomoides rotata]
MERKKEVRNPVEELEPVSVDSARPELEIFIGFMLPEVYRIRMIYYLKVNQDVIAWLHEDMVVVANIGMGVTELLSSGADVNFRDIDHRTALHVVACQGYDDVAQFLLENGENVDDTDRWGSTTSQVSPNKNPNDHLTAQNFQDRWIWIQCNLWHLYNKFKHKNFEKFRFVDPYGVRHVPSTNNEQTFIDAQISRRARVLTNRLVGTPANQLCVVPCNTGGHWILTIINPHKDEICLFDPLHEGIVDDAWKDVVDMFLSSLI